MKKIVRLTLFFLCGLVFAGCVIWFAFSSWIPLALACISVGGAMILWRTSPDPGREFGEG